MGEDFMVISKTYAWANMSFYELTATGMTPLDNEFSTNLSRALSAIQGARSEPIDTLKSLSFTKTVANIRGIDIDVVEGIANDDGWPVYRDDQQAYNLLQEFDYLVYWRHPSGHICVIVLKDEIETLLALTDTLEKLSKIIPS